jgi:hypothetical protein
MSPSGSKSLIYREEFKSNSFFEVIHPNDRKSTGKHWKWNFLITEKKAPLQV